MAQTHSLDLELSSSQYASIADASQTGLDITGNISFEAWVQFESVSATMAIVNKGGDNASTGGYRFYWSTTNGLVCDWYSGGAGEFSRVLTAWTPVTGRWYHVAATVQPAAASSSRFYINGFSYTPTVSDSAAASIANNDKPFRVGAWENDVGTVSNYFDGLIKDVRVFSDIRTQAEIKTDARAETVTDANLEGEWNFNNAYTDASGNGNTLTSSGSPVFSTTIPWSTSTDFIFYDNDTGSSSSAGATSLTFAHTCTGANMILWVAAAAVVPNGVSVSGVTYNGVAMTLSGSKRNPQANIENSLWHLVAPATGSNNVVISASGTDGSTVIRGVAMSFTGAKQTGVPDATAGGTGTGTSFSQAITTIAENCWVVGSIYGNSTPGASTGARSLDVEPDSPARLMGVDSFTAHPAGSYTMNFTQGADDNRGQELASFAPFQTAASTVHRLMLLNVGI